MEHLNNTTNRKFNQLNQTDRDNIYKYVRLMNDKSYNGPKITHRFIANKIGCSAATICRELKKGNYSRLDQHKGITVSSYDPFFSQSVTNKNKKRSHYKYKINKNDIELKRIIDLLNQGCNPITAIHEYQRIYKTKCPICEKTIYNYFNRGLLKLKRGMINPFKKKRKVNNYPKMVQKGKNISERPFKPEDRSEFGHWEGDLVVGKHNGGKECLFTLIERQTRYYLAFIIPDKQSSSVVEALNTIESTIGTNKFKKCFKSITFDNGTEFRDFKGLETSLNKNDHRVDVYYANSYHSWERGSNERGNRMIRKIYPKGTSFNRVTKKDIIKATNKINHTIRKILGKVSASEKIKQLGREIYSSFKLLGLKNPFVSQFN